MLLIASYQKWHFFDYCLLTGNHKELKWSTKQLLCAPHICQVSVQCWIEERLDAAFCHRNILREGNFAKFQCAV